LHVQYSGVQYTGFQCIVSAYVNQLEKSLDT